MIESEVLKDFQKLSSIIEEKQQKIVDLEAKLEKKEFAINNYWKSEKNKKEMFREENKKLKQQLAEMTEKYNACQEARKLESEFSQQDKKELIQQLAEKDKELHYKTAECKKWKTDYENCSKLEKLMSKEHQYCLDNWRASEQDKISFALEQLEKVKLYNRQRAFNYMPLTNFIDNQIKQLKEGE